MATRQRAVPSPDLHEREPADDGAGVPPVRWPAWAGLFLCFLGFGVAGYLTVEHYTSSTSLSCPNRGIDNCLAVTTSTYSHIQGVPVAVLGLVFFAIMAVLQAPASWASPRPALRWGRLAWSVVGLGTAVWLVYAELFRLHAICQWCTSVHILDLILFATTAIGTAATAPIGDPEAA